jgi:hypothetical protein
MGALVLLGIRKKKKNWRHSPAIFLLKKHKLIYTTLHYFFFLPFFAARCISRSNLPFFCLEDDDGAVDSVSPPASNWRALRLKPRMTSYGSPSPPAPPPRRALPPLMAPSTSATSPSNPPNDLPLLDLPNPAPPSAASSSSCLLRLASFLDMKSLVMFSSSYRFISSSFLDLLLEADPAPPEGPPPRPDVDSAYGSLAVRAVASARRLVGGARRERLLPVFWCFSKRY